jgi:hypothetical protein
MAIPNFNDILNQRLNDNQGGARPMASPIRSSNQNPVNNNPRGNYTGDIVEPSTSMPSSATPAEYQKYLYDSGLQNVFNNYQQNIATLNQQEQSRLQDAYTIREMSRKYLGEYASNLGINDVSGNLIDIYSQYQQNIGEITEQSDMMALNLQQEFQRQQEQAFQQSLQQMELQISENAQTALFNITTNNIGDMSWTEYLQSQLDSGEIDQNSYQQIYTNVYSAKMDTLQGNIQSGFFGFKTDEYGKRVPMTAAEYLEENRDWLNPADFQQLSDLINYRGEQGSGGFDVVNWAEVPDTLKLFLPEGQAVYTITEGDQTFYYARMETLVDEDEFAGDVSSSDLTTSFLDENQGAPLISGQTIYQYNGQNYIYIDKGREGAGWYRLFNTSNFYNSSLDAIDAQIIKDWNKGGEGAYVSNVLTNDYFSYDKKAETITMTGGVVYEADKTSTYPFKSEKIIDIAWNDADYTDLTATEQANYFTQW